MRLSIVYHQDAFISLAQSQNNENEMNFILERAFFGSHCDRAPITVRD